MLNAEWYHNSVQAWLTAAVTTVGVFVVLLSLRRLLVSRIGAIAARTTNNFDDMVVEIIAQTRKWTLFAFAVFIGALPLSLPDLDPYLYTAAKLVVLWQGALWGVSGVTFWVAHYKENRGAVSDRASIAMVTAVGVGAKVLLWILAALTAMKTVFGIEVTALITGLGVGGIAVALAVQNILGDLLAALAIVFDKPFDVGDTIAVDQLVGTVENIGLKTTRIRSINGEQVIIGNSDLLKSRLRNFRRMTQRRAVFNLDVPYDTPADVLERLPQIVEQVVTAQPIVRFDRCHVATFGESAIRLECAYFVLDPDYKIYMDAQQAINLEVLRRFARENVRFALPSRTVYHEERARATAQP